MVQFQRDKFKIYVPRAPFIEQTGETPTFTFEHVDFPGKICSVENLSFPSNDTDPITAEIFIFEKTMEDGEMVAVQIDSNSPDYSELMETATNLTSDLINIMVSYATELLEETENDKSDDSQNS